MQTARPTAMIRDEIRQLVSDGMRRAQDDGQLPAVAVPEIIIERPSKGAHGDYATAVALRMARSAGMAPMAIAEVVARHVIIPPQVDKVEVAPPGFLNFYLSDAWVAHQVDTVLREGAAFGSVAVGAGRRVLVEFVSANPTGPLHVGTGRGAALGDSLARVLERASFQVDREYYVNDAGARMEAFNQSVYARYAQHFGLDVPVPEDGYPGDYLRDVAQRIAEAEGRRLLELPRAEASAELGRLGIMLILSQVRDDLDRLNVRFDRWYYEQSLFDEHKVEEVIDRLREQGQVVEREGALWFASSALGEDKDNVLVRSNGLPTYFASDVAYHYDKLVTRGYDVAIDIWGADHQGHVPRMRAVIGALGADPSRLVILLYQLVNLVREGKPIAMGKRTGAFVTLREVIDEVGPDAVRFFLVGRSPDAMMDFDLDLAKAQGEVNPVRYVQFAHARMAGILRHAGDVRYDDGDTTLLTHSAEQALIRKMLMLPELVADSAVARAPHPLPYYAQELATAFHWFYDNCHVVNPAELELTKARLRLVAACKLVLAATLDLIGVTAPERVEIPEEARR